MRIEIGSLCIEHDRNYGIDRRNGYSIAIDGHYVVELNPSLCQTLITAVRWWIAYRKVNP